MLFIKSSFPNPAGNDHNERGFSYKSPGGTLRQDKRFEQAGFSYDGFIKPAACSKCLLEDSAFVFAPHCGKK